MNVSVNGCLSVNETGPKEQLVILVPKRPEDYVGRAFHFHISSELRAQAVFSRRRGVTVL